MDPQALARAGATVAGQVPLSHLPRLRESSSNPDAGSPIAWSARGESKAVEGSAPQVWLHLNAKTQWTQTCQRCLSPATFELVVDRSFRFVADEAQAAIEDETAEEDVLALERGFDLLGLIEDELLMALPLVPRHEICPEAVPMSVQDPDFHEADAQSPHPFAVLASIKGKNGV